MGSIVVLSWFTQHNFAFIMPVIKVGRKANHPNGPSSTNVYTTWKKSGWSKYSVRQHGKYGIPVNIDIAVFLIIV